ncbi:MAG: discoidin domain-containing protein [Pseudomonadota bacterium]
MLHKQIRLFLQWTWLALLLLGTSAYADIDQALNKSVTASSALQAASNVVDNNASTRWESAHGVDPSWLQVDLGATAMLSSVIIDWEAANAADYQILGSSNGSNWTVLSTRTGGTFGNRSDTLAVTGAYRYVRMLGTKRSAGNNWGYSIFSMKVMGFTEPPAVVNLAANKVATASTSSQAASNAVDVNASSRWESAHGVDPSWISVDLGGVYPLIEVAIDWEAANAANYQIQGSTNGTVWTTLASRNGGTFGNRTDSVSVTGSYRYVRMYATARSAGNNWGYSIFEFKVYGVGVSTASWQMVWDDEFANATIDTNKWAYEVNCDGGGNNEQQCYTDRPSNSFTSGGLLHLVARQEAYGGKPFTSARLRTKNLADWKYGRMEVRAKMPKGQGMWPAIWMLPTQSLYGSWPMSGEIDIFEAVNSGAAGANNIYGTIHYGNPWPNNSHTGSPYVPPTNIWDNFYTYSVEWEQGEIRWYVDNVLYGTKVQSEWFTPNGSGAAPFDQLFHMILNVAVGGDWPGAPNAQTTFPQEMVVDYVRVYRCSGDAATGKGCKK